MLWTMSGICKVSDDTRVVGKCLSNVLIPRFGSGCVWNWRKNTPNRARFFVRKKYTTFSTDRIVALRSNKIFPESYDFAASCVRMRMEKYTPKPCTGNIQLLSL
jgi:hypothetical protein